MNKLGQGHFHKSSRPLTLGDEMLFCWQILAGQIMERPNQIEEGIPQTKQVKKLIACY
jgi:hypothetical protein